MSAAASWGAAKKHPEKTQGARTNYVLMNYAPTLASFFLPRAFSPQESAALPVPSSELPQVLPALQALLPLVEAYAAPDAGQPAEQASLLPEAACVAPDAELPEQQALQQVRSASAESAWLPAVQLLAALVPVASAAPPEDELAGSAQAGSEASVPDDSAPERAEQAHDSVEPELA